PAHAARERQARRNGADGLDARQRGEPLDERVVERLRPRTGVVARARQADLERERLALAEAEVDRVHLAERAEQQSRADQQDQRERDLRRDEDVAAAQPAAARRRRTAAFPEPGG